MAATMVSAVVPATVGAADATKGFSIKTYNPDKPGISDGSSTVTVTKDQLANGDYTFPAAVYLTEDTNGGTGSFSLNLSTDSPDIKFDLKSPNQSYFDTEKTFTISSGEAETDCYISFGGKTSRLSGYEAAGRYVFGIAESQSKAGTDNYFLGLHGTTTVRSTSGLVQSLMTSLYMCSISQFLRALPQVNIMLTSYTMIQMTEQT